MSIQSLDDTSSDNGLSEDAAIEALMSQSNSSKEAEKATEGDDEDDTTTEGPDGAEGEDEAESEQDEAEGDEGEAAEGEDDKSNVADAADDQVIKYTVDGETHTMTVAEAKRLGGQEKALTRKSQELAELRKEADTVGGRAASILQTVLEEAKTDWDQYADIDWAIASRQLDDEEFTALRSEAKSAHDRFQKLLGKAQEFGKDLETQKAKRTQEEINTSAAKVKEAIPEWTDSLYADVQAHAIDKLGFDKDDIENALDPRVIIALHKARLYDLGKAQKPLATKKIVKTNGKTLTSGTSGSEINPASQKVKAMESRFRKTGSEDDAVALLMGRFGAKKR